MWEITVPPRIFAYNFNEKGANSYFPQSGTKAFTSSCTDYNLYEQKLEEIVRKSYAFHFFVQLLDFPPKTREDSIHLHESLEENLEVV